MTTANFINCRRLISLTQDNLHGYPTVARGYGRKAAVIIDLQPTTPQQGFDTHDRPPPPHYSLTLERTQGRLICTSAASDRPERPRRHNMTDSSPNAHGVIVLPRAYRSPSVPLLWQVSCYTLLSGFRLLWPPSCCFKQPTPFVGSDELPLWHFNSAFGSSHSASSAYQKWPTRHSDSVSDFTQARQTSHPFKV